MPEYLSPGVYVEEVPSANKPIAGVGTSTGAFVGLAEKGPIGEALLIGNRTELFDRFGGYLADAYLIYAVSMFFANGGTRCYVVRTCAHNTTGDRLAVPASYVFEASGTDVLTVEASSPGEWGSAIRIDIEHDASDAGIFALRVYYNGEEIEFHERLVMDPADRNFVDERINDISRWIRVTAEQPAVVPSRPDANSQNLAGGGNGVANTSDSDFSGVDGIEAFNAVDDINIVCIPDRHTRNVMQAGMNYCQNRGDCFFVAHAGEAVDTAVEALAYKEATGPEYSGQNAFNSSYGALYVPWVETGDPLTGKTKTVPPDGAVVGRYSATDVRRGVHKAPAGIEDGLMRSVVRLVRRMSRAEMEVLNPRNVNVLRYAEGVGNLIWGARTLSADPEFRYVNVRRLLLYIEESIEEGTQWVVFEPNTPDLWNKIKRNVSAFLRVAWRSGALFGTTEDQAFYVKCDAETNPQESVDLGRVITEIGVAIVKPAEFVIFRISQWAGGSEITE